MCIPMGRGYLNETKISMSWQIRLYIGLINLNRVGEGGKGVENHACFQKIYVRL